MKRYFYITFTISSDGRTDRGSFISCRDDKYPSLRQLEKYIMKDKTGDYIVDNIIELNESDYNDFIENFEDGTTNA